MAYGARSFADRSYGDGSGNSLVPGAANLTTQTIRWQTDENVGFARVATQAVVWQADEYAYLVVSKVAYLQIDENFGFVVTASGVAYLQIDEDFILPTPALSRIAYLQVDEGFVVPGFSGGSIYGAAQYGALQANAIYNVSFGGSITPTGVLSEVIARTYTGTVTPGGGVGLGGVNALYGSITPSGALANKPAPVFAGTVTPEATLTNAHVNALSVDGSIATNGSITWLVTTYPAGTVTPTSERLAELARSLGGSVTPAAALVKLVSRSVAGSVTPSGRLTETDDVTITGAVTPAGDLAAHKVFGIVLDGTISPAAALRPAIAIRKTGSITPTGTVTRRLTRQITGSIVPFGVLSRVAEKVPAGTITPTGVSDYALVQSVAVDGEITPAGELTQVVIADLRVDGFITTDGVISNLVSRRLTGMSTPTGVVHKLFPSFPFGQIHPTGLVTDVVVLTGREGFITPTGDMVPAFAYPRSYDGVITSTGSLSLTFVLGGSITPVGAITHSDVSHGLTGGLTPSGRCTKRVIRNTPFAGSITPVGTCRKTFRTTRTGSVIPTSTGTPRHLVNKRVGASMEPYGELSSTGGSRVSPAADVVSVPGMVYSGRT